MMIDVADLYATYQDDMEAQRERDYDLWIWSQEIDALGYVAIYEWKAYLDALDNDCTIEEIPFW